VRKQADAAPVPDDLANRSSRWSDGGYAAAPRPDDVDASECEPRARPLARPAAPRSAPSRSREVLERLTKIDLARHGARCDGDAGKRNPDRRSALCRDDAPRRVAIVVADTWHGRGIQALLERRAIAPSGVRQLYGDVLAVNRPMLGLVQKLGFTLSRNPDDPALTRVTLALPP
jgi:GNAT superfamily N-acetyltransferase